MSWVSLHNHSHYSLLDGLSKPIKIAERAAQVGLKAIALTDHGSISGAVAFSKALKKVCECGHHETSHTDSCCYGNNKKCKCTKFNKKPIKAILGSEFYLVDKPLEERVRANAHLVVLAKNLQGWKKLIAATSLANSKENFYYKPRLNLDSFKDLADGNLIAFSGHPGSELANTLFGPNRDVAYNARSYEDAKSFITRSSLNETIKLAEKYRDIFGKENFSLEDQRFDKDKMPCAEVISNAMRYISEQTGIPVVATDDAHYPGPEDYDDQRILLCSSMDANYNDIHRKMAQQKDFSLDTFFKSQQYYIHSPEEMAQHHTDAQLARAVEIADQCEEYDILGKPMLPVFEGPNGMPPDKYLEKLCGEGWRRKIENVVDSTKRNDYRDRVKTELQVIKEAGLSSYFLIVQDYCNAARSRGELLGPGRGSGAGCLVSYLLGITNVDPLPYDLLFERFYNAGRNTKDRVSLPDIDCDFPISKREHTIEYIRNKYGRDRVSQMVTFSRLQGRSALREVFRAKYADIPHDQVTKITSSIPDEAEISDQLQEMKDAGEEPSIIMWALENNAKDLREYCYIDDEGRLQGEYATAFRQAVRLEGTKKSQGKHAAGVVISGVPLADLAPMLYDKSTGEAVAGMEMGDLEDMGIVKFDVLGIATLDKLMAARDLLATGRIAS